WDDAGSVRASLVDRLADRGPLTTRAVATRRELGSGEQGTMTTKRFAGTVAVAFVVEQITAIAIHGFILRADYTPFYGTLLRPMSTEPAWQMLALPVSHLLFCFALVWVFDRLASSGALMADGLRIGLVGFAMGQAPLWLLWWAE